MQFRNIVRKRPNIENCICLGKPLYQIKTCLKKDKLEHFEAFYWSSVAVRMLPDLVLSYQRELNEDDVIKAHQIAEKIGTVINDSDNSSEVKKQKTLREILTCAKEFLEVFDNAFERAVDHDVYYYYEKIPLDEFIDETKAIIQLFDVSEKNELGYQWQGNTSLWYLDIFAREFKNHISNEELNHILKLREEADLLLCSLDRKDKPSTNKERSKPFEILLEAFLIFNEVEKRTKTKNQG